MGKCCSYSIFIKLIGFISVIIAMLLLGVCGWTLANTFKPVPTGLSGSQTPEAASNPNATISTAPEKFNLNENPTTTTSSLQNANEIQGIQYPPGEDHTNNINQDETSNDNGDNNNLLQMSEIMSPKFKTIVQICCGAAILIGIYQLLASMTILCSTQKRLRGKTKFWQLSHFIIILLLLMCLFIPFSYNREKDKFRGAFTFGKYIKSHFMNLIESFRPGSSHDDELESSTSLQNTTSTSMKIIDSSSSTTTTTTMILLQFLLHDLNSYYIVLSLDVIILFQFLMITCCCIQCRTKNYYISV